MKQVNENVLILSLFVDLDLFVKNFGDLKVNCFMKQQEKISRTKCNRIEKGTRIIQRHEIDITGFFPIAITFKLIKGEKYTVVNDFISV